MALNIRIRSSHHPDSYVRLLEDIHKYHFSEKVPTRIRGDQYAVLGKPRINSRSSGAIAGVHGDIHRFTQIDKDSRWYNYLTSKEAEELDTKAISVPDHLKPNYRSFYYEFFPSNHRMVVQVLGPNNKSIGVSSVKGFFTSVFASDYIKSRYGEIDVTVEPKKDALEAIFSIRLIRKLAIEVYRPNPDDFSEIESEILKELEDQDAEKVIYVYESEKGKSLKPSSRTKALAKVASQNGEVRAEGKGDDGHPLSESTASHPLIDQEYYNKDKELESSAFRRLATRIISTILL